MPKEMTMEPNDLNTKAPNQNQDLDDILEELTLLERLKFFKEIEKKDVDIDGDGIKDIIQNLKRRREGVIEAFKGLRMNFPPASRKVLQKYGNAELDLNQVKVCRKPLKAQLQKVIKGVIKEPFHDQIYHLSIRFKIKNGPVVRLDKREILHVAVDDDQIDTTCQPVQATEDTPKTLNLILEKTQKRMGDKKFFTYSSTDNNCQDYVLNVMKANDISGSETFIKQKVSQLIPKFFAKLSDIGTDIKSRLSLIIEGKGIPKNVHPLTMSEINGYYSGKGYYMGTFMSNQLPHKIKDNGAMIINLEDVETNGSGTHWVCCVRKNKKNYYFDSYGVPCDEDVLEMFRKSGGTSVYNDSQLQKLNTVTCGYYTIFFIDNVLENGKSVESTLKMLTQIPSSKNEKKVVEHVNNQ